MKQLFASYLTQQERVLSLKTADHQITDSPSRIVKQTTADTLKGGGVGIILMWGTERRVIWLERIEDE